MVPYTICNLYSDYVCLDLHVYPFHPPLPDYVCLDRHLYASHPPLPVYVSFDLNVYPIYPPLPSSENERKISCLFTILGETLLTSGVDA